MQNKHAYVSQKEVPFPAGAVLISKTDGKGFITYCNEEFERISGYSREELMGANHNIVRHPDMPPQAYKWMWHRLLNGKPWRGTVKNRCKNGDHYWVRASVSPIFEDGRITGYVSMRRAPSRNQIQEAEAIYRSHTQTGAEFFSPSEHLKFKNWSLRYKLQLVIQSALLVVLGMGQWFISQRLNTDPTTEMELIGGQIALHAFLYVFIGYCMVHFVRNPLTQARHEVRAVLQGDFDSEMDIGVGDEVGEMCQEITNMQTYLRMMVDDISASGRAIRHEIQVLERRVSEMSDNALVEQGQVKNIAMTMDQFSQSVDDVSHMAVDSLGDTQRMQGIVAENDHNMNLSTEAAGKVAETVRTSSQTISDLGLSIEKIGAIANTIKEIADQTNLLALNAAIEAARAGEQGRGFAVVADEVRKLAERTAISTKDIACTISEITNISDAAVQSMQGVVGEVETSIRLIKLNGDGLGEVKAASQTVAGRVEHIAHASKEQSAAGRTVAQNLERITSLVDSNSASVQIARVATQSLAKSADDLSRAGYPLTKCAMKT